MSLLSFALTAALSGNGPFGFKLTNLTLHLINGLLAGALLQRVFARLPSLASCPRWVAWLAAAVWVALPMHVPTVLYVVQRMTLLSATLTLVALLAWFASRERLEREPRDRGALALLWIGVPLATLLAALAKETGLLAPLLCAVFELTLFRLSTRPVPATWFVRMSVVLPVLVAAAYLATHPAYILGGYADRPFSFFERLLSQPRALWDYVEVAVVPRAERLGLYQDTFVASTGWLQPVTTLPAIIAWALVCILALAGRRRLPGVAAGIGFFLGAHLLESSVFALELFFIHRNYLPSLGLVVAGASLVAWSMRHVGLPTRRTVAALGAATLLATVVTTCLRSWAWGDEARLMASALQHDPGSLRLRSDLAAKAIAMGRTNDALHHLDAAEAVATGPERRAVRLWRVLALCSAGIRAPDVLLARLRDDAAHRVTAYTMRALETLAAQVEAGRCAPVPAVEVARAAEQWFDRSPQPANAPAVWRSRYAIARLLAAAGTLESARDVAMRAFVDSGHAFPPGVLAFQLSSTLGDRATAQHVYLMLKQREPSNHPGERQALKVFYESLRNQIR